MTLVAREVNGGGGTVGFVVFSSPEGWPNRYDESLRRTSVPAGRQEVSATVDLPGPGRIAVVALHDENGNKKLDRKASGRPTEGWGMSRDPRATLKTPSFASAAVDVKCGDRVELKMRYPRKNDAENEAK